MNWFRWFLIYEFDQCIVCVFEIHSLCHELYRDLEAFAFCSVSISAVETEMI